MTEQIDILNNNLQRLYLEQSSINEEAAKRAQRATTRRNNALTRDQSLNRQPMVYDCGRGFITGAAASAATTAFLETDDRQPSESKTGHAALFGGVAGAMLAGLGNMTKKGWYFVQAERDYYQERADTNQANQDATRLHEIEQEISLLTEQLAELGEDPQQNNLLTAAADTTSTYLRPYPTSEGNVALQVTGIVSQHGPISATSSTTTDLAPARPAVTITPQNLQRGVNSGISTTGIARGNASVAYNAIQGAPRLSV